MENTCNIGKQEIAHKTATNYLFRPYFSWNEHYLFSIKFHHFAPFVFANNREEIKQFSDFSLPRIAVAVSRCGFCRKPICHFLVIV